MIRLCEREERHGSCSFIGHTAPSLSQRMDQIKGSSAMAGSLDFLGHAVSIIWHRCRWIFYHFLSGCLRMFYHSQDGERDWPFPFAFTTCPELGRLNSFWNQKLGPSLSNIHGLDEEQKHRGIGCFSLGTKDKNGGPWLTWRKLYALNESA